MFEQIAESHERSRKQPQSEQERQEDCQELGEVREPQAQQAECQQRDLEKLSRQLQCLLAEEGFVDEPVGGCAIRDVDDAQVARLVDSVLSELKRRGMR